jgi:putative transposase
LVLAELLEKVRRRRFSASRGGGVLKWLMGSDIEGLIRGRRYECGGERTTCYFPLFLEARKSSEKALIAVTQEALNRWRVDPAVDDMVQAMRLSAKAEQHRRFGRSTT